MLDNKIIYFFVIVFKLSIFVRLLNYKVFKPIYADIIIEFDAKLKLIVDNIIF